MDLLGTFLHISDLHIGAPIDSKGDASTKSRWALSSAFDGLIGHEYRALRFIEKLFRELRREDEKAKLLVTGDLTAKGSGEEFQLATAFLKDATAFAEGRSIGLGAANECKLIPGNHDHWPGTSKVIGRPNEAFASTFEHLPWVGGVEKLNEKYAVRFVGIDTDSDIGPYSINRCLARGSFVSQLSFLEEYLPEPIPGEIRVLLLHHSRSYSGVVLGLTRRSRDVLDDFLHTHGFSILLSGHIHVPRIQHFVLNKLKVERTSVELRCGCSSVRTFAPYEWGSWTGRRRQLGREWPNTVMVHRVNGDGDFVRWKTMTLVQTPFGFQEPARQDVRERLACDVILHPNAARGTTTSS